VLVELLTEKNAGYECVECEMKSESNTERIEQKKYKVPDLERKRRALS